jgi:hypothetical protein
MTIMARPEVAENSPRRGLANAGFSSLSIPLRTGETIPDLENSPESFERPSPRNEAKPHALLKYLQVEKIV